MRRKWSLVTYALLVFAMLFVAACGSTGDNTGGNPTSGGTAGVLDANKKYTVDFWHAFATGSNKTTLEGLVKQYEDKHPNVKVNMQAFDSYDTLKTKITAGISAGKGPAISQIYENWATQFQANSAIVSLKPYMDGKNGLSKDDLNDIYPVLLKDGQIDGTQYMLPFNKSDVVLYYNQTMLEQEGIAVPKTWDELAAALVKLTKSDGSRWGMSYSPDVDGWSILYKGFGGTDFVSKDGKSAVFNDGKNKEASLKALSVLEPLVKAGNIHVTTGNAWQNDFIQQKAAFGLASISGYAFLATPIGNTFKFNEAPVPAGPSGQFTVLFGTNLSIYSTNEDTQTAAWDLMKFLISTESNATFVKGTGYMPIRQSVYSSKDMQSYYEQAPARKVGPETMKYGFVAAIVPAWDQCRSTISTNFTSALKSQLTPTDALDKMYKTCNDALARG